MTASGIWVSFCGNKNILKLDCGGACNTVSILRTTVLYT